MANWASEDVKHTSGKLHYDNHAAGIQPALKHLSFPKFRLSQLNSPITSWSQCDHTLALSMHADLFVLGQAVFISTPLTQLAQQYLPCSHGVLSLKCLQCNTKTVLKLSSVFLCALLCDPDNSLCTAKTTWFFLC